MLGVVFVRRLREGKTYRASSRPWYLDIERRAAYLLRAVFARRPRSSASPPHIFPWAMFSIVHGLLP